MVAEHDGRWAAIGTRVAAERYGCHVLRAGIEDVSDNETRFAWLGPAGAEPGGPDDRAPVLGPWKTAIVFWGVGSEAPGWLVSCLLEFASREVNLTRIESRPRKQGLGRYMFFADLEGHDAEPHVAEALEAMRAARRGPPCRSGRFRLVDGGSAPLGPSLNWRHHGLLSTRPSLVRAVLQSTSGAGVRLAGCSS